VGKIAMTGSGSGIGAATRARLQAAGHEVLGVDLRGQEVDADLSTSAGRLAAVAAILEWCGGTLDGFVGCAGVGPQVEPPSLIVSINYFGTADLLDALRPALAASGDAQVVVISSNSTTTVPAIPDELIEACLAGDEARAGAAAPDSNYAYAGSKLALARKVRREAPGPAWAGAGIRLNAVAPGAVLTPLLQGGLDHPEYGPAIRGFPIPTGGFGTPEQIAAVIGFLMSPDARFVCGSVWFADGGTDAMIRADAWPDTYPVPEGFTGFGS
jgi:NAD(P)-dependent dehydrogenase (short-subunit alcohol dehydrogenase family)